MKTPHILMMAAGTGGHVFPALAVAEELTQRGAVIHWLGTPSGMENGLVKPTGYEFHAIDMQGLRGKGVGRLLKLPVTLLSAAMATIKIIRSNQIDVVVGFGGYVTAPGGIAARLTKTPLVIHEQNAIAGMSNRYLSKIATKVLQAFEHTFASSEQGAKLETVGNPVRNAITGVVEPVARYDVNDDSPLKLLVVGGSLGARVLNDTVPKALALLERPFEVRHQCGRNNETATQAAYAAEDLSAHQFTVQPFIDDMAAAYNWADVIVCRAGALTVTEIQNVGIAAIFVPLPHAVDDHQTANARTLTSHEAAILLPQAELTAQRLSQELAALDRRTCLEMAKKGHALANRRASMQVADIIWQTL
ncbi:undecaprenyldiphospho-muramoylpentapeptide beta-N-acetylglucosaminyltransferase [Psychrobacter sp. CCUG 69069]|jgi:UDP-N-acetylglucosamine--N-acetylmuramyl-(pentapeptide) pyrophosphoryl-undecaprenol N-acetylglucosamine transferase|uniref:undecaprenyldiphospho-muramoylpentapeptide beta-N-acetylglucosaminyltransferase n=1 Tax=Psychrobacter sp. CCUG 69069 TaxID=2282777 RepID=UPI001E4807BC|nr:undecaprenyldiphospho-muramoylpentapeptide beta-N-acetylglucosaminyltransferase [Psychrobacter sp. CCUG 69069]MCD1280426.1 undecaprenyldiphospho-muramoylpentapeptide beta-N-acetylglucosaminyltransferase [Psychrobacter sp. CCUG 69069]